MSLLILFVQIHDPNGVGAPIRSIDEKAATAAQAANNEEEAAQVSKSWKDFVFN